MQTITLNNETFDVDVDGTVHQPRSFAANTLDDVRVLAGHKFLADRDKPLTGPQRRYWTGVTTINPPNERLKIRTDQGKGRA